MEENERKPIFTNIFVPGAKYDKQVYWRLQWIRHLLILLFSLGSLGYIIYNFIRLVQWSKYTGQPIYGETLFWICLACFALYTYLIVRVFIGASVFSKREQKRRREMYGTEQFEIEASFFDDKIDFQNLVSRALTHPSYSVFRSLFETKDLFLLVTREKQVYMLAKDGFEGTDAAGFRRFMDEKCPNAKRRWK